MLFCFLKVKKNGYKSCFSELYSNFVFNIHD